MMRFISSVALAIFLSVTSVFAQSPVLTNGGFEQNPPNTYGNHIGWAIAPWVLTSGSANVVGTDGPGGLTWYGNDGPHSDASGSQGGNGHYLDQTNTAGAIYQEFTPLCSGEVRYGAYFSTRQNRAGNAQVSIKDATGSTTLSGPASVTIPAGDSINDPWQLASFTATLTAGTTYRFEVFMNDNFNMDNAYVAFGPECTEHTSPDWSDPESDTDPDPVPELAQCSPFMQQEVTCNTTTGLYEVTISNSLSGTFNPTDITVTTSAPGVAIAQNPFDRLTLLVTGATPGQVIPISTAAISTGAGAGNGLDLCCNGEMEITIPDGVLCETIDDPDDTNSDPDGPLNISIDKTWHDFLPGAEDLGTVPHGFEVVVDLEGGTLQPGDVITVDDPASGQVNVTSFGTPVAPAPWTCSENAGSWSCSYVVPQSGAVLPASIFWPSIIDGSQHVKNCASADVTNASGTGIDMDLSDNESCWSINQPADESGDDPTVSVEKTCSRVPAIGLAVLYNCEIVVSSSGPVSGTITLDDTFLNEVFPDANGSILALTSADPWTCNTTLPYSTSNPASCTMSGADLAAAGGTSVLTSQVVVPGDHIGQFDIENCAAVAVDGVASDESCAVISEGPADDGSDGSQDPVAVNLLKECEPLVLQPDEFEMTMDCTISITPSGPFEGTLTINDIPTKLSGMGDMFQNPPPALSYDASIWNCTTSYGATCTADGASYPVDGNGVPQTTTIDITLSLFNVAGDETLQNCAYATLAPISGTEVALGESCATETYSPESDDTTGDSTGDLGEFPEFNVFKSCAPLSLSQAETLTMDCTVTVQPLTPYTGTLTINDVPSVLSGGGTPSLGNATYDSSIWTCGPAGGTLGCTAQGASYPLDSNGAPLATTIDVTVTVSNTTETTTVQNCAGGDYVFNTGTSVNVSDYCVSQIYTPIACTPVPEIPGDMIDNDCDGFVDETINARSGQPVQPELSLTKTALGACRINERSQTYACDFALILENGSTDAFNGPVNIRDTFGTPSPRGLANVQGDGFECLSVAGADEVNCLAPDLEVEPGSNATLTMTLTIPGLRNGGSFENCAAFGMPDDPVTQNKIIQSLLNDMGINVGSVDGVVGPNTRAGITQLQQQQNWPETGEASVALLTALGIGAAAEEPVCTTISLPPMPEPRLVCDPSTSVLIDGACECRFSRMMQTGATSCACISGTQFEAGQGCIRPQRQTSSPSRPTSNDTPNCPSGSTYNAARGACVATPPQGCRLPNQSRVNGACVCDRGFVSAGAFCVPERDRDSNDRP